MMGENVRQNRGYNWREEKQVLSILPHPDDEAFGFSGTLLRFKAHSVPVSHVCATLGEMGRNMGQPPLANRESLPRIRREELRRSMHLLGIHRLYLLGRHDKMLEFEDQDHLAQQVWEILAEEKPSVIFTFYPGLGVHQDHDALAWAVVQAVQQLEKKRRPRLFCRPVVENAEERLGPPDLVHDVTDLLPQKVDVMRAHRSQVHQMFPRFEEQVADPDSPLSRWLSQESFWIYPV